MNWRNLNDHDYFMFARSYHAAAKKLAAALDLDPGPAPDFDLCPVLSMYRHAIELHLKVIVLGEGGNFLATKPDELSVQKTRSLSWLAQFVVQIITNLQWGAEFTTEGINDLGDFKGLVAEANDIEVTYQAFRCPADARNAKVAVLDFLRRMDALIALLQETADALAAEWDLRSDPALDWPDGKPTIH